MTQASGMLRGRYACCLPDLHLGGEGYALNIPNFPPPQACLRNHRIPEMRKCQLMLKESNSGQATEKVQIVQTKELLLICVVNTQCTI